MKPEDKVEIPVFEEGTVVERINKADMVPIHDTNHDHLFELDPDDETDTYYAEMCIVQNCGLGRLVAKN